MKNRMANFFLPALVCASMFQVEAQTANPRIAYFRNAQPEVITGASTATNNAANILAQGRLALAEPEPVKSTAIRQILAFRRLRSRYFLAYLIGNPAGQFWQDFITALENARQDEQVGAGAQGSSTSLVSKAGAGTAAYVRSG